MKTAWFYCWQLQNDGALNFAQCFLNHSVYKKVISASQNKSQESWLDETCSSAKQANVNDAERKPSETL